MFVRIRFFILFFLLNNLSYGQTLDSLSIRNFNSGDYKASSVNYSAITDENGYLYFANENGIIKYDGSEWYITPIKGFGAVYSLHITEDGRFYVGGNNEFGYLESETSGYLKYYSLRENVDGSIDFKTFWSIEEDKEGNIFFASYEGIVKHGIEGTEIISIENSDIYTMDEKVYAAVYNGDIYEISDDSISLFSDNFKWEDDIFYGALPSNRDDVQLLYTTENGLFEYNKRSKAVTPIKTEIDAIIKKHGIYEAELWMDSLYVFSTWTQGLVISNMKGELVKHLKRSDGLNADELFEFTIDKRNNLWLTSVNGISYLKWPLNDNANPAATVITRANKELTESGNFKSISIHFATPGFDKTDLQYKYFLEGYDDDFGTWNGDIKKEYTNLDGGQYTFNVKAKLPDGTETENVTYNFSVPTLWYKDPINQLLILLALILMTVVIFRFRTRRLKLLNQRLEYIIGNRTKELIAQREQLKKTNEELMLRNTELDNFVYRSSHDLVAPLKSISGLISLAQSETKDANQIEYMNMMSRSVEKLEDFINSIMDYSVNSNHELIKQPVKFNDIIEEIVSELKYYEKADKIELIRSYDTELVINTDAKRLKIVLSNLITNSIKYHNYDQKAPMIEIKAAAELIDKQFSIEVIDNGIGIEKDHLESIFDMFFRASNSTAVGSGLGLYIVKDTLSKIDGEIEVISELKKGTNFKITLEDAVSVNYQFSSVS